MTTKYFTNNISLFLLFLCFLSCDENRFCTIDKDERHLQTYKGKDEIVTLLEEDNGAWGATCRLQICDTKQIYLIEELALRGEDDSPTIDSIVGKTIYIHYSSRKNQNTENLEFESVVLGEALLDKKSLKYNYIFKNVVSKETNL